MGKQILADRLLMCSPWSRQYIGDVFSADTYTGNGTTKTITNNINLASFGGMIWWHNRGATGHSSFQDYEWASLYVRWTDQGSSSWPGSNLTYNNNGFAIISSESIANANGNTYIAWTFREAPKFFAETMGYVNYDMTYSFPELDTIGMVIVQGTYGGDSPFWCWHRSLTSGKLLQLGSTAAETTNVAITVSGTDVTLHSSAYDGGVVVVYAFAHDSRADDGLIQCGSFTTNGSGNGTINHGWSNGVQAMWLKCMSSTGDWEVYDTVRTSGWTGNDAMIKLNAEDAESSVARLSASGTSISLTGLSASQTYIYMIIVGE